MCAASRRLSRCTLHRKTEPTEQRGVGGTGDEKREGRTVFMGPTKDSVFFSPSVLSKDTSGDGGGKYKRGPSVTL